MADRTWGARPGEGNPNWKGGRTVTEGGYVLVKAPEHPDADVRGYVYEHRLIAAQMLGRPLAPGERVRHRDGDPGNNHPSNLRIVAPLDRTSTTSCACGCGAVFTRLDRSGRARRYLPGHNSAGRSIRVGHRPSAETGARLAEHLRAELTELFAGLCAYGCGRPPTCWDHVVPWAAGGTFRAPGNTVPACQPCNASKSDGDPWPWIDAAMATSQGPAWADVVADALALGLLLELPEDVAA